MFQAAAARCWLAPRAEWEFEPPVLWRPRFQSTAEPDDNLDFARQIG